MAEATGLPTDEAIDQMKLGKLTRLLQEDGMTEEETDELNRETANAELKRRIKDIQATAATRRRPGQAAENLREILDTHNSKRECLAELCHHIAAYLPKLDDSNKEKLKIQFGHEVDDILKDVQSHLDKAECRLLVAGETSSGKSTFLNLLLGEDILPVAHESSTSTVCEVKYGEKKKAVVHLRQPTDEGQRQITIPLDGPDHEEHQQELKSYIHLEGASRDGYSRVACIEIFWPLPLLKGGIVIVDSPGVGESDEMDGVVADYIPKAFAFLYIIDSYRAGGVQPDRLGKLLKLYTKRENAEEDFDPESAIFISNKLDLVPAGEQEKVKKNTFKKLSEMWRGLKDSQLFFVSTKKAVRLGGILSEDFTKVLDGLDSLMQKSLDIKLETQYRLLTRLLSAALIHINVLLNIARQHLDKEAKMKKYQEVKKYIQAFQDKKTQGIEALESMLGNNIPSAKDFLSNLVKTGKLKKDLMAVEKLPVIVSWVIPSEKKVRHQDVLADLVHENRGEDVSNLQALFEALGDTLAHCPSFENFITLQEKSFKMELNEVVKSIENAQQRAMAFITGSSYSVPQMDVTRDALFQTSLLDTVYDTFLRGVTMSFLHWPGRWSATYLLEWQAQSSTESILQRYWDQAHEDTPLIDILMQALSADDLLTELAKRQVQPQRDLLSKMEDGVKKLKDIMDQTIEETLKDERSNDEILQMYKPQSKEVNSFLGQLAMFHLTKMRKYDYDLDSITGWTNTRNKLGGGSFGEVYRVQVPWKGAQTPAALKLGVDRYEITTKETAWEFLLEEENLRNLKGEHIVKYYGTACKRVKTEEQPDGLRLGLVMELCDGTLDSMIIAKEDYNPGQWRSNPEKQAAAFSKTQNLAIQLCEGLKTIHDKGYLHRDLKLINILVTKDTVKLADVGLTKPEVNITGTAAGTPLYAAPEVWERKVYDKSADIYSLGFILFEMWYGVPLYGMLETSYVAEMEKYLKEGKDIRMPTWKGTVPPISGWRKLIHDCLKKDPSERPEIQECLDRISAMKI